MFKSGVSEYSVCLCEVCMFPALLMLPDSKYNITVCIALWHTRRKNQLIQFTRVMYFAIKYLSNLRHYVTFPPLYLN